MSKVRAYKLAEELGIERMEFVDKVRELGIDLKSAMASLDDEQTEMVRDKLGRKPAAVTEARVEKRGAKAVIRRRKKKAEPTEEVAAAPGEEPLAAPVAEEEPAAPLEAAPETEPTEVAPAEEEPEVAPAPPMPEPAQPQQPVAAQGAGDADAGGAARRGGAATDAGRGAPPDRKGRQRKAFKEVVNLREQQEIARQVTSRTPGRPSVSSVNPRAFQNPRRKRRDTPAAKPAAAAAAAAAAPKSEKRVVRIEGSISVAQLASELGVKAAEIQGKLMSIGTMVSINQAVDVETARSVATEYGFEIQDVGFQEQEFLEDAAEAKPEDRQPRPPVVTVMGHVDHGKTSLLDAIRQANVVEGEAGGITQHIGAYQAQVQGHLITFIDTPGHAAFTAMRARGAQVTDVVVLVVAANDGVMPQTVEAINHSKAAGVPIVVAINKCDLPDANPQQARQRLMEHDLIPEEFGGDVLSVEVSATKGTNVDKLLETILLQAELLELRADPDRRAQGVVLEANLDKGRGPMATVLIQQGTLRRGDIVVVGTENGRVRSMLNEHGQVVEEAGPSMPVQVLGLSGVPTAGEDLHAVESDRVSSQIVEHRIDEQRRQPEAPRPRLSLEELFEQAEAGGVLELNLVIKADTDGSVEAVRDALLKIESDKVKLNVIHAAVGAITERDVQLAHASGGIIVGFHVRPDPAGRKAAESHGVDVRLYQIIYELLDEVRAAMAGLLPPLVREKFLGRAEVRETFNVPKVGTIAGCFVAEGMLRRNAHLRLVRDGVQMHQGRFGSLKRFKDDVREVQTGFECGVGIDGYNDIKVGDVIEAFEHEELAAEL